MSIVGDDFHSMAQTIEPDVQATLSDFLTFTEHFPSHLTRALTLIRAETRRVDENIAAIHADTKAYGALPTATTLARDNAAVLRKRISYALEEVGRAGRMRLAEATRLAEMARREHARLDTLVRELRLIPLPTHDPSPEEPAALTSPNLGRTARLGVDTSPEKAARTPRDTRVASKFRARKVTVPGEVLPPPDPDAVVTELSDWSSPRSSPDYDEVMRRKAAAARPRSRTPKPPRPDRGDRSDRDRKAHRPRGPRQPGQPGTNAHSAIAGISTSNALLALNPPPADAVKGSRWLPWMKLTEWEMATLRKRMKKNAIWVPSATMLRRELKDLGRGHTGREEARLAALAAGEELVDESNDADPTRLQNLPVEDDDVVESAQPTQTADLQPPAYENDVDEAADAELSNRGMRLNEAKKIKRARLVQEQLEAAAQIEREQANELALAQELAAEAVHGKKRKRDSTPQSKAAYELLNTLDPLSTTGPPLRKLKLSHNPTRLVDASDKAHQRKPAGMATGNTITVRSPRNTDRPKLSPPAPQTISSRRPTLVLKAGKAVSEEPPNRRASLRRNSNASLPSTANTINARSARRSKRPAPGLVTAPDSESARVSASRRKDAPGRKSNSGQLKTQAATDMQEEDEQIGPDEPRYCICGDVSWGAMIACDNDNCEKEWFHLDCVKLDELPPRRTKWYCPDCRKKLKQGQTTNGLVGRLAPLSGNGR